MAAVQMDELALANIAMAEFVVDGGTTYATTRIDEVAYSAVIDEGQETILRVKNEFVATNRFDDLQYGSDLTFKQVTFTPEILELIDGGTCTKGADGEIESYAPPAASSIVNRKLFKCNVYVEVKNKEGKYACFAFDKLKGKPATFSFKDGEFVSPEYGAFSRLNAGEVPYEVTFVDELPEITNP